MTQRLNRVVKCLALLVLLSIVICIAVPQNANVSATSEIVAVAEETLKSKGGYQKKMESKSLGFYIETNTGKFSIVNKENGAIWYSNPTDLDENKTDKGLTRTNIQSQLLMEYVNVLDINKNAFSTFNRCFKKWTFDSCFRCFLCRGCRVAVLNVICFFRSFFCLVLG